MKNPLISVVMPVYNAAPVVGRAIHSILTQTYQNFEFLIIDDGSTDSTSTILARQTDPRVKIITHTKNLGIVKALNHGLAAATGTYLARMDADDFAHPTRLYAQLIFLQAHPRVAAVGSFTKIISLAGKLVFTIEPPTTDRAIKQHLLHDSCLAHGSVMLKTVLVKKIGGYRNSPKVRHAEDYDLFVRLAQYGQLANLPQYLYTRTEHERSVSHQHALEQQRAARYIAGLAQKTLSVQKSPAISVLMPTYNNAKYLGAAIKSVMAQTYQDWELVIVDDASTDGTKKVISKYLADPRILYLANPERLGKARSRNRLLKESTGQILVELDADDSLSPDALNLVYPSHLKAPDVGLIYSQFYYCDEHLRPTKIGFCRKSRPGETNLHDHHATALRTYKRRFVTQTSGFDVTLDGAEDLDMVYKLEEVAPIQFLDYPLYYYRIYPRPNQMVMASTRQSLIARLKANCYAYLRRRQHPTVPNITLLNLVSKTLNDLYSFLQTYLGKTL